MANSHIDALNTGAFLVDDSVDRYRRLAGLAITDDEGVIAQRPDLPQVHHDLGHAYFIQRNYSRALEHVKVALRQSPSVAQFYITLSRIYLNLRRENDAAAILEEGLIQAPLNAARIYIEMGDIYKDGSRYEEALSNYTKAVLMEPELWIAHYKKGVALHSLTRIDEAEESLQRAYELNSEAAPTLHFLGMVSLAHNNPDEAENTMRKAVALDSMKAEMWFHLGQSQMRQQKWTDARESLNRAHSIDSKISEVLYNLSEVNKRLGDREAAKIYALLFKEIADFEEERDS